MLSSVSGAESVPEKLENFYTLMRLSAWEDFIEFCRSKKSKYMFSLNSLAFYRIMNQQKLSWK
jgi:hypothetical protein